jgi:FtsZ-interacting cell division protein ZipA
MAPLLRRRDTQGVNKASTDDETRLELSAVAIVVGLSALIALVLIGLWLGGVWTGLIIVGLPVIAITVVLIWGTRSARASDPEEAQMRSPGASSDATRRS